MIAATNKTIRDIKTLKIQGAENVAKSAVNALAQEMKAYESRSRNHFLKHLSETTKALSATRPTEPGMRNWLRVIEQKAIIANEMSGGKLSGVVTQAAREIIQNAALNKAKIAKYGAGLIPKNSRVLIHCHSSTLMAVLKKAHDERKNITVTCCETRPLYQGRVSAAELSRHGIPTTLVVDGAANAVLKKSDLVIVGSDAVTAEGALVNKIGTSLIAQAALVQDKKFYSATGLHKYDPATRWGASEPIEERDAREVLPAVEKKKMPRVKVWNPAFDVTPASHVTAFITEEGVLTPGRFASAAEKKYSFKD
ncbi:MAG TPA: S-methyl-5-thioribose-1-phosphate isomerase [Candidatus Norongarragalinales archaeon]|jgi:ribose 1,5-bisphosphate isomerase|nr:S-methyl-5-thioribose-1-phosphate isomerase [Candidatus Norongarragalinales archaeon]